MSNHFYVSLALLSEYSSRKKGTLTYSGGVKTVAETPFDTSSEATKKKFGRLTYASRPFSKKEVSLNRISVCSGTKDRYIDTY